MSANSLALIELLLIFGLVAWFGYSQLRALKRDDNKDAKPPTNEHAERPDERD